MGTWKYLWYIIFSCILCTETIMALTGGTRKRNSTPQNQTNVSTSREQDSKNYMATYSSKTTMTEMNTMMSLSLLDTSPATPSIMRMVEEGGTTETVPMMSAAEGSSLGVSVGSETTSPFFATMRPDTTDSGIGTASGSAAPVSLRPSSPSMSHSSSSPLGLPAATPSLQQSSASGTTEAFLTKMSHPAMTPVSSAASSSPGATGVGSGTVTAEMATHSPAASVPSPEPSTSAAATSPTSHTTEASLMSMMAGSVGTQATWITSASLTLARTTDEVGPNSLSTGSPLSVISMASAVSNAMTSPSEGDNPITTSQGSSTTTEPSTKVSLSFPDTSVMTYSTMRMVGREETTETVPTTSDPERSSLGVSVGSETTSPFFATVRPDTTDSVSLRPSSPSMSHSSSSPLGLPAATPSLQQSSASGTTEAFLTKTSHPATTPVSAAPSSSPGVTSLDLGVVTAEMATHSSAASVPSPEPSTSAAATSPTSHTTEASLMSMMAGSVGTQAAWLTSSSVTLGQTTSKMEPNSTSTERPLSVASMASTVNRATTPPGKDENPITNQGSHVTTEPSDKTLSDTSLVTESMMSFRKSTSVYSSSTVNCLPVSIEVQNVTGEAIQFSWTSGRRGSLYTISLMDGNQELNRTTTKETKTAFERLHPGRVYKISVAVLPCAENSWTSVTVRTDPVSCFKRAEFCLPQNTVCPDTVCSHTQAFACRVLLTSQIFNHTLYDSESEDYKAMTERIRTQIVKEMRIQLKDDHFDIMVLGFRPGSVIAYFISLLQRQEPIDENVIQAQLSQAFKSSFGGQVETTVQTLPTQSSTGVSSGWKVAVIVLGVLLGVALVVLLLVTLLYICMKKRSVGLLEEPC